MVEQNFDTNTGATINVEGEGVLSGEGAEVDLDISSERIDAGASAGNLYINKLESIRDELDNADDTGTTLGKMVAAQLKMTEAEIVYLPGGWS